MNDRSVALEPVNVASVPVVECLAPPPTAVFSSCATETSAECPENVDFPQVFVTDLVVQAHPAAVESGRPWWKCGACSCGRHPRLLPRLRHQHQP